MDIKETLIAIRESKGYSKKTVSEMTGIPYTTYIKYESGERKDVNMQALCKLADFYEVTTDYLLGRPETKPQPDPYKIIAAKSKMESQEQAALKKWLALDPKRRKMVLDAMAEVIHEYENTETSSEKPQEKYIIQRAARGNPNPNAPVVETIEITAEERKRYHEMPLEDWDL
ncbi:MAG: helix-turn-helix domain-containing protein [Ruminococcus sp.]|nr:helix-turn-helix domain-containing protein [Ruminococcus sp.]